MADDLDPVTVDPHLAAYVAHLRAHGRDGSAKTVRFALGPYLAFLAGQGRTAITATVADVDAYRAHLAGPSAAAQGGPLARATQTARLWTMRGFHRWLLRRRLTLVDPTDGMPVPRSPRRVVTHVELDQQEAQALLDTVAAQVAAAPLGSRARALAWRDLTLVALAMATGRRRSGLRDLRVTELDLEKAEMRVEREKGVAGRVVPFARWCAGITAAYLREARPRLLRGRALPWLFVGKKGPQMADSELCRVVVAAHAATCAANPDLTALPGKRITPHSLRVTCARLLFANGCPIRSVNAQLLHKKLATTASYTPIPVAELRRVLLGAHPRA
jgi:integrase/recombinase XerD